MMNRRKSSYITFLFVLSLIHTDSFAIAVKPVCMDKFAVLHCSVQGPFVWKYKDGENWRDIGYSSKNETFLSPSVPYKLKNVTKIFPNGSLVFLSFAAEMSGVYKCKWINEKQIHHRPHIIIVVAVNCEKTVCEGDDATIECEVLNYKDLIPGLKHVAEIVWKKGNSKMDLDRVTQKALRIKSVSKDLDGQRYTCVVHGESGATPRHFTVNVRVKKCQKKIEVCEGDSIDLECPYYQPLTSKPKDTRQDWYNGSAKIATSIEGQSRAISSKSPLVKINRINGVLTLLSTEVFDSGLYRCKVFRETMLLAEHNVTVNVTQCVTSTSHSNSSKKGSSAPKRKPEAYPARAEKIRDNVLIVLFAVFVVFGLPICLYCMVTRNRPQANPDQAQGFEL